MNIQFPSDWVEVEQVFFITNIGLHIGWVTSFTPYYVFIENLENRRYLRRRKVKTIQIKNRANKHLIPLREWPTFKILLSISIELLSAFQPFFFGQRANIGSGLFNSRVGLRPSPSGVASTTTYHQAGFRLVACSDGGPKGEERLTALNSGDCFRWTRGPARRHNYLACVGCMVGSSCEAGI